MNDFNPLWIIAVLGVGGAVFTVARWTAHVDAAHKGWTKLAGQIGKDLEAIRSRIDDLFKIIGRQAVASSSPMHLTEFGEELAVHVGAKVWAAGLAPTLRQQVAVQQPFEVDAFCGDYVQDSLSPEMTRQVAATAYQFGIKRDDVLGVLRVVLRDELLSP